MEKKIKISVHDLVDNLLRKGDIDNRFFNYRTMEEGTKIHDLYQKKQNSDYYPEYFLSHTFTNNDFILEISGRADGVIQNGTSDYTIDEIKTSLDDLDDFYNENKSWHLGQAEVYAYFLSLEKKLERIKVQLTYISQVDTSEIKKYMFFYTFEELESKVLSYIEEYCKFLQILEHYRTIRDQSIKELEFPFNSLRKFQKEIMDFVSLIEEQNEIGFLQAKTGSGKTISTLYPSIKNLQRLSLERIFYLTSKNSIKQIAFDAILLLEKKGLKAKSIVLNSRENMCVNVKKGHCNPDECIFAKGYYTKLKKAIVENLEKKDNFDKNDILTYCIENQMCPFEFQLDLALYIDIVIADYNYLFDPHAKLRRFFDTNKRLDYLLLIDEAHNLPSRTRDMFSVSLSYEDIFNAYENLEKVDNKYLRNVKRSLRKLLTYFSKLENSSPNVNFVNIQEIESIDDNLYDLLDNFVKSSTSYFKKVKITSDAFLNCYFLTKDIISLADTDDRFIKYFEFYSPNKVKSLNINCIDSTSIIKNAYNLFSGVIAFSATLTPSKYYFHLLGGDKFTSTLYLPSPFPKENQLVLIEPFLNTFYKNRDRSIDQIIKIILDTCYAKKGNYFVFFPSFEYLNKVRPFFNSFFTFDCFFQDRSMNEEKKEEFLSHFVKNPIKTTVGFLVLGGIFSEGIDLKEDRLIGSIIISVGLPTISFINQKLLDYYKGDYEDEGFDYAYTYPGLNKVFQAAGRVIRTINDVGIVVLADIRYSYAKYENIINETFENTHTLKKNEKLDIILKRFWKEHE